MSRFPNIEALANNFYNNLVKIIGLTGGTFEDFKEDLSLWAFPQMKLTSHGMVRVNMSILGFEPLGIYCVYTNNTLNYIVGSPSEEFFFDLEHRFMVPYQDAIDRYLKKGE